MSALARYLNTNNSNISGSDRENSSLIEELIKEGIKNIWVPHNRKNIEKINPDLIVYSTAVTPDNAELIWAKENKKEIIHRSDLLDALTSSKKLISVSGTHGKTTTSAMITHVLIKNNLNPQAIIGGIFLDKNTNIITGSGDYFVIEADESDKSFLKGNPEIAVITNIEPDHLENFPGGFEEIKDSFLEFAKKPLSRKGLVVCFDDKTTREIITKNFDIKNENIFSYGINEKYKPKITAKYNATKNSWDISVKGNFSTSVKLTTPGRHNVLNALAAFSTGYLLGISPEKIKDSIESYPGVKRRFQILTSSNKITIIDDYAHHPTEIAAVISSARELNPKRIVAVLQPHQPGRLKDLWNEFIEVLKNQDFNIFITDTYIARGSEIEGINSKKLVQEINKQNITYLPGNIDDIAGQLEKVIKEGDLVLIMGAGDITNLGPKLLKACGRLVLSSGNN